MTPSNYIEEAIGRLRIRFSEKVVDKIPPYDMVLTEDRLANFFRTELQSFARKVVEEIGDIKTNHEDNRGPDYYCLSYEDVVDLIRSLSGLSGEVNQPKG